ncbi:unnamed protein product [Paramecium sonneborni]|uniref:Uncharacterized protein n=1 Tax=Paramecium sonneborni TaxID=65129 RepID=A0A8S1L1E1_9CILI|nr:unnamed protein product [Paramecium sonneborni]
MFKQNDYPKENIQILNDIFQDLYWKESINLKSDLTQTNDTQEQAQIMNSLIFQFQKNKEFDVDLFAIALKLILGLIKKSVQKNRKRIQIRSWNHYAKKYMREFEVVKLYLQILYFIDQDQEQIEDQIKIIAEIYKNYSHDQDIYSLMIDLISERCFQKSPQWLFLIDNVCQIIIENYQNLPINIRSLRILNKLFLKNSDFTVIQKYGLLDHIQNVVYLYIDNQTLCGEVTKFLSILVNRHNQEFLQIFVRFNFIISIFIQHLENDQIVFNTMKILGCFLDQKAFSSGFVSMEVLRLFAEWSNKINIQKSNLRKISTTSLIMLLIIEFLIVENKISEVQIDEYLVKFCINLISCLANDEQICIKVYQIICKYTMNKNIINQLFQQNTFQRIENSFFVLKHGKQFQLIMIQFINSLILNDIEKIDIVITSILSQQILMSIQNNYQSDEYEEIDIQILFEMLRFISLISLDNIKCLVIWNTDRIQMFFYEVQQTSLRKDQKIIEIFFNILSIYSQLEIVQDFLIRNTNALLEIIEENILMFEICDDYAHILQNLINNQNNNIHLIIDKYVPLSLAIIKNQPEQQTLVLKFFDMFEQISKIDLQTRLRIQDLCQTVIQEFEQEKFIHPYLNTLNEYIGRCSFSYQNLLTKEARDYLVNGIDCKLYKDDGSVSNLLVFITPDLASIWCKHHGDSNTKQKWRLATKHVISIKDYLNDIEGWRLSPFRKFGKKKIDINSCFTITGNIILNKQIQLQNFHICAPTAQDKYKMFEYLRALVQIN